MCFFDFLYMLVIQTSCFAANSICGVGRKVWHMEFCDTFQRVQNGRVVYYLSAKLRAAGVRHGFSTRLGGVSTVPHLRQMNFGFLRGEDIEITRENYRIFACALGIDPTRMVFTNQTHTTKVYPVGRQHAGVGVFTPPVYIPGSCKDDACNEVDGLVSGEKGLALGIRVADCVPVLLYDPVHGRCGTCRRARYIGKHL